MSNATVVPWWLSRCHALQGLPQVAAQHANSPRHCSAPRRSCEARRDSSLMKTIATLSRSLRLVNRLRRGADLVCRPPASSIPLLSTRTPRSLERLAANSFWEGFSMHNADCFSASHFYINRTPLDLGHSCQHLSATTHFASAIHSSCHLKFGGGTDCATDPSSALHVA